jgi:hypothetical protein
MDAQDLKLSRYTLDTLREICRERLFPGDLWKPSVSVARFDAGERMTSLGWSQAADVAGWYWRDVVESSNPVGPFESERDALVNAIETEGLE